MLAEISRDLFQIDRHRVSNLFKGVFKQEWGTIILLKFDNYLDHRLHFTGPDNQLITGSFCRRKHCVMGIQFIYAHSSGFLLRLNFVTCHIDAISIGMHTYIYIYMYLYIES